MYCLEIQIDQISTNGIFSQTAGKYSIQRKSRNAGNKRKGAAGGEAIIPRRSGNIPNAAISM